MKSIDQDEVARRAREFQPFIDAEKKLAREWLEDDANGKRYVTVSSVDRLATIFATIRQTEEINRILEQARRVSGWVGALAPLDHPDSPRAVAEGTALVEALTKLRDAGKGSQ